MLPRTLSVACLAIIVALASIGTYLLLDLQRFETNILALLPTVYRSETTAQAVTSHTLAASRSIAVVIQAPQSHEAQRGADSLGNAMRASGLFTEVRERVSSDSLRALEDQLLSHPFQLSRPPDPQEGRSAAEALLNEARSRAFSSQGLQWLQSIERDPLLRLPAYLHSIRGAQRGFTISNGYVHLDTAESPSVLVTATLHQSGLANAGSRSITRFFDTLSLPESVKIFPAGIVFFSEESASRAEHEVSTITSVTLLLVTVFLWWIFRTLRVVLVTSSALVLAFVATLAISHGTWVTATGSALHLITIGFGSALLGVSSDYALHYFIAHRTTPSEAKTSPLKRVRSGLLLGFVTTVIGFLGIALSFLPGLQQLALFSVCGLAISLLLVFLVIPRLAGDPTDDLRIRALVQQTQSLSSRRLYLVLGLLCGITCIIGLPRLTVQDDIRVLSTPSPALVSRQREVARLTGASDAGVSLIVHARDDEELLSREEHARLKLDTLIHNNELNSYRALSQIVPSRASQDHFFGHTAESLARHPDAVEAFSKELHLPLKSISLLRSLTIPGTRPEHYVSLSSCLTSGACDTVKDLYLGNTSGGVASVITLRGFKGQRNDLWKELDGVELVNHAGAISAALKHYREVAMVYTALVYLIVIALLVFRYGPSHALRTLIPPTLGAATSLAILALCGVPINVFSVFALLVLVGLSIDYAIFCAEDDDTGPCTNFAVLLSAITTAISFGLLSFSSTPALRSFGIVLSIGVMVAALIAPLAGTSSPTSATRTRKVSALVCMLILLSGCSLRLPKPRVTTSIVSDQGLFRYVCPNTPRRGERSIPGEEQRLAVLECRESSAVVVLLNRHGLRIQTVTLTEEGTVQSETSYLAEDPIEPEALLSEFSTLSPASTHF